MRVGVDWKAVSDDIPESVDWVAGNKYNRNNNT